MLKTIALSDGSSIREQLAEGGRLSLGSVNSAVNCTRSELFRTYVLTARSWAHDLMRLRMPYYGSWSLSSLAFCLFLFIWEAKGCLKVRGEVYDWASSFQHDVPTPPAYHAAMGGADIRENQLGLFVDFRQRNNNSTLQYLEKISDSRTPSAHQMTTLLLKSIWTPMSMRGLLLNNGMLPGAQWVVP